MMLVERACVLESNDRTIEPAFKTDLVNVIASLTRIRFPFESPEPARGYGRHFRRVYRLHPRQLGYIRHTTVRRLLGNC